MTNILLITDAWHPQVNGVVTTLSSLVKEAKKHGHTIYVFHPGRCKIRFSLWFYPEIKIAIPNPIQLYKLIQRERWDHIHIATIEGPLGFIFSRICNLLKKPYSASLHSKFPEFVHSKWSFVPIGFLWNRMKDSYKQSSVILTTTDSMVQELREHGFEQEIISWTRGVDRDIFYPDFDRKPLKEKNLVCVSRISVEKNLDTFCSLKVLNTRKILVGDGPYLKELKEKYLDVEFVGKKTGQELGDYYRNADVFVFTSKTDTFGVVNIEALACGTPVAAYPVTGPKDIVEEGVNGFLSNDLESAITKCFSLQREDVWKSSLKWSWENCYKQFNEILLEVK